MGDQLVGVRADQLAGQYTAGKADTLHSFVVSSMRALKRHRRRRRRESLILPGRDVWSWEVLARRQRIPTVFDARISRQVARHDPALIRAAEGWRADLDKSLVFDTGFNGTIWSAIRRATGKNPDLLLLSGKNQIFPRHAGSRQKALAIEYLPKYWTSRTLRDGDAHQYLADMDEFVRAAILTVWLYRHKSPRRVHRRKKPELRVSKSLLGAGGGGGGGGAIMFPSQFEAITATGAGDTSVTYQVPITTNASTTQSSDWQPWSQVLPTSLIPVLKDQHGNPITG